jgi:hypothetical protein
MYYGQEEPLASREVSQIQTGGFTDVGSRGEYTNTIYTFVTISLDERLVSN